MSTLNFSATINASKEKVWDTLWNDETYKKWTAAFMEGSHAESDWKEGSKIKFLDPNGSGMFSIIQTKKDNEQMVFKHLGEIKNGVEELKNWDNATESYFLKENNGVTTLDVELNFESSPQFEDYFNNTFPKALEILKGLAES